MKHFIIILAIFISLWLSAGSLESENNRNRKVLLEISLDEYRRILPYTGPLDRLFIREDTGYFIASRSVADEVFTRGFRIKSVHGMPEQKARIHSTYADINGMYHNYSETLAELTALAENYPDHASLLNIGSSVEGRGLWMLKISDNVDVNEAEPDVYIVGCHHAREWISVEIPLMYARYLLENMESDPEARKAVEGAQIWIMPILNPDGLEFSIKTYRYWRKNRKYNGDYSWGVDLNRNYSHMWGMDDEGSSPLPASEIYRGTSPFSEPEVLALRDFMNGTTPEGVLSYHNFSQLILFPWGYTNEPSEDFAELDHIGQTMSRLMFDVNGREYPAASGSENLYFTNGGMVDWIYATFRAPAYTIELPPEYSFEGGFFTSNEEIGRTFSENLPAMLYFTTYFIDNHFPAQENRGE